MIIWNGWVFGLRTCPPTKILKREPNPRKPLNPNCFILCVKARCFYFPTQNKPSIFLFSIIHFWGLLHNIIKIRIIFRASSILFYSDLKSLWLSKYHKLPKVFCPNIRITFLSYFTKCSLIQSCSDYKIQTAEKNI